MRILGYTAGKSRTAQIPQLMFGVTASNMERCLPSSPQQHPGEDDISSHTHTRTGSDLAGEMGVGWGSEVKAGL